KDLEIICRKKLTKDEVAQFRRAVDKDYNFEMHYDELPLWGLIRRVENREETEDTKYYKYFLYKHIHFNIHYNMDRVIEITARMDPHSVLDLTGDREVDALSSTAYLRDSLVLDYQFLCHCPPLTGFLATILMRVLKNDFIKTIYIFMMALVGVFYPYNRGAPFTTLMVIYALTSSVAGYTSTSFYCQLEGTNWVNVVIFS
ncbi:hypothetical protein MTR67_012292, partial [Solanum verrucosum]